MVLWWVQVEETLKPEAAKMGNGLTWQAMIASLQPKTPFPPTSKLTAYALWDGTQINDDGTGKNPIPCDFCAQDGNFYLDYGFALKSGSWNARHNILEKESVFWLTPHA